MSDHDDLRSARDVDADAERFVDDDAVDHDLPAVADLPPEGSVPDIIDQHIEVPEDDDF
ncbi:MAG: hypothetical protein ACM3MM_05825 [Acidobacteriota bacterium]